MLGEADVEFEINDYIVEVTAGIEVNELLFFNFGNINEDVNVPVFFSGDLDDLLIVDNFNVEGSEIYIDADGVITTAVIGTIEFELDYTVTEGAAEVPCEATFVKL